MIGRAGNACAAIAMVIGFMAVQSQARSFGFIPVGPAGLPRLIHPMLVAGRGKFGHVVHTSGVGAGGLRVLSKQASTLLADRWQIAGHLSCWTQVVPVSIGSERQ